MDTNMDISRRIFDKLDKLDERLDNMDKSLLRQTITLEEHVKRTNLLEEEIRPMKKHMLILYAFGKIFGGMAVLAAIIEGFYQIIR